MGEPESILNLPIVYTYDDIPEPSYDGKYRVLNINLIKYVTGRVRRTIEMKKLVDFMKRNMNINKCSFYKDFTMEDGYTIELHHSPLCLFDIVQAVCNKHFAIDKEDPYIEPWRVEEEVNLLHYRFMVGLVPLNPTAHSLVHSGKLTIHPKMVAGNWRKFRDEYCEWLSEEAVSKLEMFETLSKTNPNSLPDILKYKPVLISNVRYKSLGDIKMEHFLLEQMKSRLMQSGMIDVEVK